MFQINNNKKQTKSKTRRQQQTNKLFRKQYNYKKKATYQIDIPVQLKTPRTPRSIESNNKLILQWRTCKMD